MIKNRMIASILMVGALALAACSTSSGHRPDNPPGGGGGGSVVAPGYPQQNEIRDEQAMIAVEAAYNVAASAFIAADSRGLIPEPQRDRAGEAVAMSYEALRLARAAHSMGDAATFEAQAREVGRLTSLARELIPK